MDGRTDGRMDERRTDGRTDGRTDDGRTYWREWEFHVRPTVPCSNFFSPVSPERLFVKIFNKILVKVIDGMVRTTV